MTIHACPLLLLPLRRPLFLGTPLDDALVLRKLQQSLIPQAVLLFSLFFGDRQPIKYMTLGDVGQLLWWVEQKSLEGALDLFEHPFNGTSLAFHNSFYLKLCQLQLA